MDNHKIAVMIEVSADSKYCERCDWLNHCPPGCRFFKTALRQALGSGAWDIPRRVACGEFILKAVNSYAEGK